MPALYAHNRYGNLVKDRLTGQIRGIIDQYPMMYQIGLQGPDFLFFYKPIKKDPVNQLGYQIHQEKASFFMKKSIDIIKKCGANTPEYAYLMGFICHFMLDSECHPFVSEMIMDTKIDHIELESEFEKWLMEQDGLNPIKYPMEELIPTDRETAVAMAPFYPEITVEQVEEALREMKFCKKLLTATNPLKRGLIKTVMKMTGRYDRIQGHLLKPSDNPKCVKSNKGLSDRLDRSVIVAADVIKDFHRTIVDGKELSSRFNCDFE